MTNNYHCYVYKANCLKNSSIPPVASEKKREVKKAPRYKGRNMASSTNRVTKEGFSFSRCKTPCIHGVDIGTYHALASAFPGICSFLVGGVEIRARIKLL